MMDKEDFENILWACAFQDWRFAVVQEGPCLFLQVQVDGRDNVTGEPIHWAGRKWFLFPTMTRGEVVQTAFKAVLTALEHEARESFLYAGLTIYDPHLDLDKLWACRAGLHVHQETDHEQEAPAPHGRTIS